MKPLGGSLVALWLFAVRCAVAIELVLSDPGSIKTAAATIAYDMMTYYTGNITGNQNWQGYPGILQLPYSNGGVQGGYYWWEAGGMWGALIDYWYYTGDTSYNDVVTEAIVFQSNAPALDFMTKNQSNSMGNDDQGFWGMTAMTAAEVNFPAPPTDSQIPGWLALAQGVWNEQLGRWDNTSCAGGMRWQVFPVESGYNYKNSISNGVFFNIGTRLARYTNNDTYYDWANETYAWMARIGLLNETTWAVFDGSDDTLNCSQIAHEQWTYNVGIYLFGVANLYNYTSGLDASNPRAADAPLWKERLTGLATTGLTTFFQDGIMLELCEASKACNTDQKSFKTYLARWMAATTKLAPFTYAIFKPLLETSAQAAALQCSGGVNSIGTGAGRQCGLRWTQNSTYDGDTGVGQQMAALEVIQSNLIAEVKDTFTNSTGGTSQGDPNAGSTSSGIGPDGLPPITVTTSDKVGAGFITFFTLIFVLAACLWMIAPERINDTPGQLPSQRREWGWGDLSMGARIGRRQFTPKGYADRDSIVLEKLKMPGASGVLAGDRGSSVYGSHQRTDSSADVYESGVPFNNVRPGSRGVGFSSPSTPVGGLGAGSAVLGATGSRPGSSRSGGVAFAPSMLHGHGERPGDVV